MTKQPSFARCMAMLVFFALLLSGCQGQSAGTSVWIDAPVDHLNLPHPQDLAIQGHATSPSGIARVEIYVNDALLQVVDNPPREGSLANFEAAWVPSEPGGYVVRAVAYGTSGSGSASDTALVTIGGPTLVPPAGVTISPGVTVSPSATVPPPPDITDTPVIPVPPEPVIQFRADPATIEAGKCSTLYWDVKDAAKVVLGGVEQPFSGSYEDCMCETRNYPITVTALDGEQQIVYVQVTVTGTCEPPADTTAPEAPAPAVPSNGLSLSCRASQTLAWLPVSDPSGIAEYQVQVQRSTDHVTWSGAAGSPITGLTDKTSTLDTECGWIYRWRVRAVDGAGNTGAWSDWSIFSIILG
jgi:hypothetical protein